MEKAKSCLVRTLNLRMVDCNYSVKGKDRGKLAWHFILVDWGKKDAFLKKSETGSVDVAEYGKILASGWGEDVPENIKEKSNKFIDDISKKLHLLKLGTNNCETIYYVMSYEGKELEIGTASSVEDIRRCGKILYSSLDEEPPEALVHILVSMYFGNDCEVKWNVDSRFNTVLNGDLQKIQEYLNSGRDINCSDSRGWTLLHHFAKYGRLDIVSFLKSEGADIQIRDKICGRKPVHIAAKESQNSVIQFFLTNGAVVNETDNINWTLLHYAAWKGNAKTVRLLIEKHADVNAKSLPFGKKPIHVAAEHGHTDVIKVLLDNGVSIEDGDDSGRTPIYYAALIGHLETAKFLVAKGADIYKKTKLNTLPIHAAATYKNTIKVVELFLALGVDIDVQDGDGLTPLHRAADQGDLELVQFLVNNKAKLDVVDTENQTPLDRGKKHTFVFLYLLDKMGSMCQNEGKFSDALKFYREMLEIQKEKFGPTHSETLKTRHQEAHILYNQGQYDEAAATLEDVLATRKRCLGDNHIHTLDTKHRLGLVYSAQIKFDKAIATFEEVLEKRRVSLGAYHHDTLKVAHDLASVHFKKGELDKALEIFRDVLEKRRAHFSEDHQDTLQVRHDMAKVLVNKGEYKTALQTFENVWQKRKDTLGDNHPDTLLTEDHISIISEKFKATELKESSGCLIQ